MQSSHDVRAPPHRPRRAPKKPRIQQDADADARTSTASSFWRPRSPSSSVEPVSLRHVANGPEPTDPLAYLCSVEIQASERRGPLQRQEFSRFRSPMTHPRLDGSTARPNVYDRPGENSTTMRGTVPERGLALQFNRFRSSYGAEWMGRKTALIQWVEKPSNLCVDKHSACVPHVKNSRLPRLGDLPHACGHFESQSLGFASVNQNSDLFALELVPPNGFHLTDESGTCTKLASRLLHICFAFRTQKFHLPCEHSQYVP